jgi:regulation of enolase protein 1 (concanavalin A-like superfamily)
MAVRSDDEQRAFFHVTQVYPTTPNTCSFRVRACCPPPAKPAYLRLERRGDWLTLKVSEDDDKWQRADGPFRFRGFHVPHRLKVGMVAETAADATFQAVFDQFRLIPLGGKPGDS